MRIKWSSDAAQSILWQLREAEQNMNDCIREAAFSRSALEDANPGAESKTLNRLMADFEETLSQLQGYANELDELVRATQNAKNRFEDAEKNISGEIDSIATGTNAAGPGYCPPLPPIDIADAVDVAPGWIIPEIEVLPRMRLDDWIQSPVWFMNLLNNQEFFTTLMNR